MEIITKGLPKGVTLVSKYHHSNYEYVMCVDDTPVAYVYEKNELTYERWVVHKYLTDDKKFVDDIMHKYREYLKDICFANLREFEKQKSIEEDAERYAANISISSFQCKKSLL